MFWVCACLGGLVGMFFLLMSLNIFGPRDDTDASGSSPFDALVANKNTLRRLDCTVDDLDWAMQQLTETVHVQNQLKAMAAGTEPVRSACILLAFPSTTPACSAAAADAGGSPTAEQLGNAAGWLLQDHMDSGSGNSRRRRATLFSEVLPPSMRRGGEGTAELGPEAHATLGQPDGVVVVVHDFDSMPGQVAFQFHPLCDDTLGLHKKATYVFPVCVPDSSTGSRSEEEFADRARNYMRSQLELNSPASAKYDGDALMARIKTTVTATEGEEGVPMMRLLQGVAMLDSGPAANSYRDELSSASM